MNIDAGQATIITDRCVPPNGLGPSPSTLKLVLWCLRGLGAPGADLCIPASIIERRTCLSRRGARNAMTCLREHGILTQTKPPAPNRSARYTMNYLVLADWLDAGDWEVVKSLQTKANGGTICRRSEESGAAEQGHLMPPSKSTGAPRATTGAPDASTPAPPAGDIKEETALPAKPASTADEAMGGTLFGEAEYILGVAAAGGGIFEIEDWAKIAKSAGHEINLATQLGETLVTMGVTDREIGRNALERIYELDKRGGVRNPPGLMRSFMGQPGGAEQSKKSIARKRSRESLCVKFVESVFNWSPETYAMAEAKIHAFLQAELGLETTALLMPGGRFEIPLAQWPAMVQFASSRWNEIDAVQLTEAVA